MKSRTSKKADAAHSVSPGKRRAVPVWVQRTVGPLVCGSIAAACIPLGVLPVIDCVRAMLSDATFATLGPRDAVTIPLGLGFTFFAAMFALPDPEIRLRPSRRSSTARRASGIATVLFAGAGLSMLMVPLAAPVASVGFAWMAAAHDYVECPPPASKRHAVTTWAHDKRSCPKDP